MKDNLKYRFDDICALSKLYVNVHGKCHVPICPIGYNCEGRVRWLD